MEFLQLYLSMRESKEKELLRCITGIYTLEYSQVGGGFTESE